MSLKIFHVLNRDYIISS